MIAIVAALAPLFLIIAIGYGLSARKFGGAEMWNALDHITFYVLFPALLAKTLMRADLASVAAIEFLLVSLGSVTIMGAALLASYLAVVKPISGPAFTSFFQGAIRFQSTVAVAISAALFGERGLTFAALSVACLVPVVQFYTVIVLLVFGRGNQHIRVRPIMERLALNPPTLGCLLGFLLNRTGVPDFIYEIFSILGTASIGLTLLAVGAGLNMSGSPTSQRLVAASIVIRLVGMPLLVFGLAWLTGLSGLARTIAIVSAAVPSAPTAYTMARKMGGDAELMAQIITFQSIVATVTLPLFIYWSQIS